MRPMSDDLTELVLNRTWRPALSITGMDRIPPLASAGNVLRPQTAVKQSLRLPPTLDGQRAGDLDRKTVVQGQSVLVRVDIGGPRIITNHNHNMTPPLHPPHTPY